MSKLTEKDLHDTFEAFNRHDIDAVMTHFADDCVFTTVAGDNEYGNRVEGRDAIAKAFSAVWAGMPDAEWADHSHVVNGDNAVSRWTFKGTDKDGNRIEAEGVDLFTIKDGKLVKKEAFRKQRPMFKA